MTGRRLAMGTRKMPPLSVGDKVLVQNQTGRVPNKWDMSGVIVECKPYDGGGGVTGFYFHFQLFQIVVRHLKNQ